MTRIRSICICSALALAGCATEEGDMDPMGFEPDGELPRACEAGECPTNRRCEEGVCLGNGGLEPSSDVEAAVRHAARVGCERLENDCSYLCEGSFASCSPSVDACVEDETARFLDDYDFPVLDPVLAAQCAAQIDAAPCSDLTPDTEECEHAVVESCPGDEDGFGGNYSPFHPTSLAADGTTYTFQLCDDVEEWYALELEAAERLSVMAAEDYDGQVSAELHRMRANAMGEAVLEEVAGYIDVDGDWTGPVAGGGVYLLSVRSASRSGVFVLTLRTAVNPPTERPGG